MTTPNSKWSAPNFAVCFQTGAGAPVEGQAVNCRVVEIAVQQTWDIVPGVNAQTGPFSEMSLQGAVNASPGGGIPASLGFETSPVTYSGPGDLGPALRVNAYIAGTPGPLPPGTTVNFRALRNSA